MSPQTQHFRRLHDALSPRASLTLLGISALAATIAWSTRATAQTPGAAPGKPDQSDKTSASPTASAVREFELPIETGTYRQGEGVQLAQTFCLNCHSVEYCEVQPPSPEKYWAATVKKMKEKFGAPLPDEMLAPLTKYLTEAYGTPAP